MKNRVRVNTIKNVVLAVATLAAVGLCFPEAALAQLRVSSIDWVQGRPEIPHPALNGRSTILMAIAEGGNCGGNYRYRWDVNGDGDFDDGGIEGWRNTNSGGSRGGYFAPLGLEMTFPDSPGDRLFYPKVEVSCAGQIAAVAVPYLVRVERICPGYPGNYYGNCGEDDNPELTRQYYHDRIVDRALWWMFNRTSHYGDDGRRGGIHACVYSGSPTMYAQGHMLNAFLRRSHGYGPGRDIDVYYRHQTYCGINALIGTYNMTSGMWFNDSNDDGWDNWRLQYTSARLGGAWFYGSYGSTAWVEPIVNYGNPQYQIPGGEGNVRGRTMRSVGADLRDGVLYCMGGSGQWFYSCRSDGHPDQSTSGWAPESMRLLGRKFDLDTYGWARNMHRNFAHGCCSYNNNNDHRLFGCTYHPEWSYSGGVGKLAGNALVSYGWTQNQDFYNNAGDTRWRMNEHWRSVTRLNHNWWGLYYMYATTKGLRSFVPEIRYMENDRSGSRYSSDWAPNFAHFLVTHMRDDQWWRWCSNNNEHTCHWHWHRSFDPGSSTTIATQIVQTWLEAQAMARANPQSTGPGIPVTFNHQWSHILDPNITLTRFRWNVIDSGNEDRNGNGRVDVDEMQWEFTTADQDAEFVYTYDQNLGWNDVINKKVTLEVQDSQGRTVYDDKSVQIQLSLKNHKPVVVSHPDGNDAVYTGYFGMEMQLDGSSSYDTDECADGNWVDRRPLGAQIRRGRPMACNDRNLFPGDGNRPRAIPDYLTSICFDINFNNRWCEAGEVQFFWQAGQDNPSTNLRSITFTPREDMAEGDIIGVPVRVCDDGRWNGKCYQNGDGAPGNYTRGDCTECGYGTAPISVVRNADPPTIAFVDPPADTAEGSISVSGDGSGDDNNGDGVPDDLPQSGDTFIMSDSDGTTIPFVFDSTTTTADGTLKAPEAKIALDGRPGDGDTFILTDHRGNQTRFVFDHLSDVSDGTVKNVLGISHVVIGLRGTNGNVAEIAQRMQDAINNATNLEITAAVDPGAGPGAATVSVTQNSTAFSGNTYIDMEDVDNVASAQFRGGVVVGTQGVNGDPAAIAARIASAIEGARQQHDLDITAEVDPDDPTNVIVKQGVQGFDGNTEIDTDDVTGVESQDFFGGRTDGWVVAPGERIMLDFSPSRDPEGVMGTELETSGIFYRYDLPNGGGTLYPTTGFDNRINGDDNSNNFLDWSNWGTQPYFEPSGDGERNTVVRVIARDYGGMEQIRTFNVQVTNAPPVIESISTRTFMRGPVVQNNADNPPEITNLGNRRYRVTVAAAPDPAVDVKLDYVVSEPFNEAITVTADINGDGNSDDGARNTTEGEFSYAFRQVPDDGLNVNMTLTVTDGEDTVNDTKRIYVPPIDEAAAGQIQYSIDVGNDGSFELVNRQQNWVEFVLPPGTNTVPIVGSLRANGHTVPFDLGEVTMPNTAPIFLNPRLVRQDAFDVVIAASAIDRDGDPITISVDWGDGNTSVGRNVIYRHSYRNSRFQTYTVNLRVVDDRGASDTHQIEVDIVRPATREADISSLTWERITETEGNYDGVRGFAIDPAGSLFAHNYLDKINRSVDGGDNWVEVLDEVECCGMIAARNAGEIFVASPGGLYFSGDNGDNWALWAEAKFDGVTISPDKDYVLAATQSEVQRYDMTGALVDTYRLVGGFQDIETCAAGNRSAMTTRQGTMLINDRRDMAPAGWNVPEDRFAKGKGGTSVTFDKACNLYQGMWNGYRLLRADNSIMPATLKAPKHLIHAYGSHTKNIYGGVGNINDMLVWPDSAVVLGSDRGIWGENEPWNAYRKPYWKKREQGVDRSKVVRRMFMHPTNGYAYMATSSAVQMPKYCRKARRNARRNRSRRRRGGVSYYYVFCGFRYNFFGGVYRSENPLLLSRTVGEGGSAFDPRYSRGVAYDGNAGGLVVTINQEQDSPLWLVNTEESTVSRWDAGGDDLEEVAKYRVGLQVGECNGQCCFADGCNMASRVSVDSAGNVYVASRGFGMQGTVTKIAGDMDNCVDRNNNNRIDTAQDANAMDYGADECVLWTAAVGPNNVLLRALAVDIGDATHPDGYVWVGGYNNRTMYKLNPATGVVMETVNVQVRPHNAIVMANGDLYIGTLGEGSLQSINTQTNQAGPVIANPAALRNDCVSSYGLAADERGRIWMNGWTCPDAIAYDPADQSWCRMDLSGIMNGLAAEDRFVGRGLTSDTNGRMFAAIGGDGRSNVAWWNTADCQPNTSTAVPGANLVGGPPNASGPTAIGPDSTGRIWLAHYLSPTIMRIDPNNAMRTRAFDASGQVYSFSDFTGVLRRQTIGQGTYSHEFEADCDNPIWTALDWTALTPDGSQVAFTAQTSARRDKLDEAPLVNVGRSPGDVGPINVTGRLTAGGEQSRKYLRIRATLSLGETGQSSVLGTFTVRWNCD